MSDESVAGPYPQANQPGLFDSSVLDGLESLLDFARRTFRESWRSGDDSPAKLRALTTAQDVTREILEVLAKELSEGNDLRSIAKIAHISLRVQNFSFELRIAAERKTVSVLDELSRQGVPLDAAMELASLSEDELITMWRELHPGTGPEGERQ